MVERTKAARPVARNCGFSREGATCRQQLVAHDGTWLIKRRDGGATSAVSPKTPSDAVKKPDASGKSTNGLALRCEASLVLHVEYIDAITKEVVGEFQTLFASVKPPQGARRKRYPKRY